MKIRQNLHVHSVHSCDSASSKLEDLQKEMINYGMKEFGISDHMHSRYNMCDIEGARNDFYAYERPENFHFGVELSCMNKWECEAIAAGNYTICPEHRDDPVYGLLYHKAPENADYSPCLDITAEDIKRLKIEYVIAGVHWPLNRELDRDALLDEHFKQLMFLAEHPLVDIIAHPWDGIEIFVKWKDWTGESGKGRFDFAVADYSVYDIISGDMSDKLLEAFLKNDKAVELNLYQLVTSTSPEDVIRKRWQIFCNWREAGAKFTIGSDLHGAHENIPLLRAAGQILDHYGFTEDNIRYFFDK